MDSEQSTISGENARDHFVHFGKLVKAARKAKGEKQDTLALAVGISEEAISRIENGTYPSMKYELLIAICTYLKIPLSDLPPPHHIVNNYLCVSY